MIDKINKKNKPLWSGRFSSSPDKLMQSINASIKYDKRLYEQDIKASVAHTNMLVNQNILTKNEGKKIIDGLLNIKNEIKNGKLIFNDKLEDIHSHIEYRLIKLIGKKGKKLHTARSRNDQVATDMRLWARDVIKDLDLLLMKLQKVMITIAETHYSDIMPGFTHLQPAQPITLGHYFLAYVEMIGRDRERFNDAASRLNECPLGSAALAGTSFPINRDETAVSLGFNKPMSNSIDAVSDRDFVLEILSFCNITSIHLSRLAEDIVIWSTPSFGFILLSDEFSTGSSIMPQKKNPDVAELVRAKTGRIIGNLVSLSVVLKGLPLAYSKDMQEDKEPLFDSIDNLILCVKVMSKMLKSINFDTNKMLNMTMEGNVLATELADWLVKDINIPFREAHQITGKIVSLSEKKKCHLHELKLSDMRKIEPRIHDKVFDVLDINVSIKNKSSYGGTSPDNVYNEIITAKEKWL